ncbi:MAG: hypothetical protein CMQ83_05735 [Gammaproteobacteria bacterium]|nr:hypothetical protein [Gammaproteobacteria bacterium]
MQYFKKIRYYIDKSLARSFIYVVYLLALIVCFVVACITAMDIYFGDGELRNFSQIFLDYFFAAIRGEGENINSTFINILINTLIMLTGLFVSSIVIGILVNSIAESIDNVRSGKSFIDEKNHQLILGWSNGISLVFREFLLANSNNKDSNIVFLDEINPVEANEKIMTMFPNKEDYQKIIPKQGRISDRKYLEMVNVDQARSILINHDDDMESIKAIAAIVNNPERKKDKYNIVSKMNIKENYELAKIIGGEETKVLFFGDMLARVGAQSCLQSGLANVYLDLVNFDGDEIYFHKEDSLVGKTYEEAILSYETSSIIGIEREGDVLINPKREKIKTDDSLIAISMDDDTVIKDGVENVLVDQKKIVKTAPSKNKVDTIYIFGYCEGDLSKLEVICSHLINYLDDGSKIFLVNDNKDSANIESKINPAKDIQISFIEGNCRSREFLEQMDIESGDKLLILSSFNGSNDINKCDAQTLFTLINLRDIEKKENKNFVLTTELINSHNAEIFASNSDDDYLYSEDIVQSMLVQIAENPFLSIFFDNLASPEGSEIYFKSITEYVDVSEPIDFYTICQSASFKGETAIGYQTSEREDLKTLNAGVNINPLKSKKRLYNPDDKLIVFADD